MQSNSRPSNQARLFPHRDDDRGDSDADHHCGAVVSLVKSSMSIATATYELTDAQESLRTAQEFISRDLMSAGDGLRSMTYIPVTTDFRPKVSHH